MSSKTKPQAHVPEVAAQWINHCVRGVHSSTSSSNSNLSTPGHRALNLLTDAITMVGEYKKARKADLIQMIRKCFYADYPTCNIADTVFMSELQQRVAARATARIAPAATSGPAPAQMPSHPSTAAMPTINPITASAMQQYAFAAMPMPMMYTANGTMYQMAPPVFAPPQPQQQPQQQQPTGPMFAAPAPPPPSPPTGQKRNRHAAFPVAAFPADEFRRAMLANIGTSSSSTESRSSSSSSPTYVKAEGNRGDPDTTPQNDAERNALGQLQQMGFNDNREILASFRRLEQENNMVPSVDSIMLDLVAQLEEAEEARRMDEARKLSEAARKDDAKRRRQELEQELQARMESSSMDEWLTSDKMFSKSWLLRGDAQDVLRKTIGTETTSLKVKLITILRLEQKARKWYGGTLPRAYFQRKVTDRLLLARKSAATMLKQMQSEIDTLEVVMFQLCEQTGGVPTVFRNAHDEARAENDDEDSEVLLVVDSPRDRPIELSAAAEQKKNAPTASKEVIDVL